MPVTDSPRSRFPLPHWGWFLLAIVSLLVAFVGLSVWLPYHREQQAIHKLEGWGAEVATDTRPEWLAKLVGEDRIAKFKVFERIVGVRWQGTTETTDAMIAHLSGLTNLGHLNLANSQVTDAGLAHLSALTNLSHLNLSNSPVTDSELARLSQLTDLRELYLAGTSVKDAGLVHLSKLPNLRELRLDGTAVKDDGLAHLSRCTNLKHLYLAGTKVTDKGITSLKKAIPDCEIHRGRIFIR